MFHFVFSICNSGVIDEYQAPLPKALSEVSGRLDTIVWTKIHKYIRKIICVLEDSTLFHELCLIGTLMKIETK
jgi:hypothetical protein